MKPSCWAPPRCRCPLSSHQGGSAALCAQGRREGAGTQAAGSSLHSRAGLWTLLRILRDPRLSLPLPCLYSALIPSWVSHGSCWPTAGPRLAPSALPEAPLLPAWSPGNGAKPGDVWRPGPSWAPGEVIDRTSCSQSTHLGAQSPGMTIRRE